MIITHKLTIDLARRGVPPRVDAMQGDTNTREVEISLTLNRSAWPVPPDVTAAVAFLKPDGTRGLYDKLPDGKPATSISDSAVTAILAPQALTCAGTVLASVVFYDADMDTLATFPFKIIVEQNPAAGEQVSNNYYTLQNLDQVNQAYTELLERMDALEQGGSGITAAEKTLILELFRNAAYISAGMGDTLAQLEALWGGSGEVPDEPAVTLMSIFATYGGGDVPVGTAVTDLTGIVVTAHYSDGTSKAVTDYALSGTIAEGSNTITVSYGGKSTTFVVTGVSEDEPESTEPVYQLAQETVFDGTSGIDTGYTLLDKDKSWSVCVDFTGNGKTVWDASPNASKGMALTNRGGYFRTLYAALQQVDISGGNETNHKVIVTHTKGTNSVQYHYIYEGASRVDGEAVNEKYLETDNIINVKPTTVKLGTNFNDNEKYNGTIHRFEIYERVLTADEINAFMGVSA